MKEKVNAHYRKSTRLQVVSLKALKKLIQKTNFKKERENILPISGVKGDVTMDA